MAHFAELDENFIVKRVIVVNNSVITDDKGVEQESLGIAFCKKLFGQNTNWAQCSYNGNKRHNYPGRGYAYRKEIGSDGAFVAPKPYESWVLDSNARWEAPVAMPDDGKLYRWDENTTKWVETRDPAAKAPKK
jgi:hypothetical protein